MKLLQIKLLLVTLMMFYYNNSAGQGCSDAGFCTINSFKPNNNDSNVVLLNQVKVGLFVGDADFDILAYGSYIEYNRLINNQWSYDLKITSIGQSGNKISVYNVSDAFLNLNYKTSKKINLTIGAKLPFSKANKPIPPNRTTPQSTSSLPMDYQASLGTIDLILGIAFQIKKLQLATAIQQPITQNKNTFAPNTSSTIGFSELNQFTNTNQFKRSGDVLLRISYPFIIKNKLTFTPSLLPIYHLANDKYTDFQNIQREIKGSKGLTLNGNLYVDYELNSKNIIQLNIARPFIVRAIRPDGLTRSLLVNFEYKHQF